MGITMLVVFIPASSSLDKNVKTYNYFSELEKYKKKWWGGVGMGMSIA